MADRFKRRPEEDAIFPELTADQACLLGECGPWIKTDRAEFHHLTPEMQQWLIRSDKEETADLKFAILLARRIRSLWKWTKRCVIGFFAAFGGVYAFGEKLGKLPETTQAAISGIFQTLAMLRKLL